MRAHGGFVYIRTEAWLRSHRSISAERNTLTSAKHVASREPEGKDSHQQIWRSKTSLSLRFPEFGILGQALPGRPGQQRRSQSVALLDVHRRCAVGVGLLVISVGLRVTYVSEVRYTIKMRGRYTDFHGRIFNLTTRGGQSNRQATRLLASGRLGLCRKRARSRDV